MMSPWLVQACVPEYDFAGEVRQPSLDAKMLGEGATVPRYAGFMGFPELGVPQNGWFTMGNPSKMDDDWG